MTVSASGRTWDEASSPAAVRLVRRFETAWRAASGRRPDPEEFVPADCPGARLALLRADLTLRFEAGEPVSAERYRDRYPDLDSETLVALVYEEYCLREEKDGAADPDSYLARFPQVASALRRVFDIHGLVGSVELDASHPPAPSAIPFPEAGQTIGGFQLVEELGRGAFARVFLARERQLADRPVALKVSRTGSREPQTLARLQHTHIVPVHSYRTDAATGLHLLCMPYFGRVTLAQVLADPQVKVARSGGDLIEAIDRLGAAEKPPSGRSAGRDALERRSYAQAIAWWGARMAEALAHAHDRGVLHRDVKPSNVLVTGDGMPMLLDFNLARDPFPDDPEAVPATLGGTLDYMAPEHLEALADGLADRLDGRSDVYGLGVVLYEALAGFRPFPTPRGGRSATEMLLRAAEQRRLASPRLRETHPEVPAALEAVVRCCLAADPIDRYGSAAELAADLQAVADDRPLPFAREPFPHRVGRWVRRRRRPLAMAALLLVVVALAGVQAYVAHRENDERRSKIERLFDDAKAAFDDGEFTKAEDSFNSVKKLAEGRSDLDGLAKRARELAIQARQTGGERARAEALFQASDALRFHLIAFADIERDSRAIREALEPFYVIRNPRWATLQQLDLLEETQRVRLIGEVNELLFLWAIAYARTSTVQTTPARREQYRHNALWLCERSPRTGAWQALLDDLNRAPAAVARGAGAAPDRDDPRRETEAAACVQWARLREYQGDVNQASAWLLQAVKLKPGNAWYHYLLGYNLHQAGNLDEAHRQFELAYAIRPDSPWILFARARLYWRRGSYATALEDFQKALRSFEPSGAPEALQTRLELGVVYQSLGDLEKAREYLESVIEGDKKGDYALAARLNLAKRDADAGAIGKARAALDALLAETPTDAPARLGRALLALRLGAPAAAESDLSELLRQGEELGPGAEPPGRRAEWLADRALARLALGRPDEAEADAREALRLAPSPARERLRDRALLALGAVDRLELDDPDEPGRWPLGGAALAADLRAAADLLRLSKQGARTDPAALRSRLTRAVLLGALRDPEAESEASRAVADAPLSPQAYLVRARIRHRGGDRAGARADLARGLELQPRNPHFWELRGTLEAEAGAPREGLADLDQAIRFGADDSIRCRRARTLLALGRIDAAQRDWTRALEHDPEDPRPYLGRARAFFADGSDYHAFVDLEQAAAWTEGLSPFNLAIALTYARCLPRHPDRLPRILAIARRAWSVEPAAWPNP